MNQIQIKLDIDSLEITAQSIDNEGNIIIDVVSKCTYSICHKCGKPATKRDGKAPIRYACEYCDDHPTTTEQYSWSKRNSSTTHALDEYLMRGLINSTIEDVSRKDGITSEMVQSAVNRNINKTVDWSKLDGREKIAVQTVKHVCTDMYEGYVNAVVEVFGLQALVIDRYHVAKLYRNPLDKLRIKEMQRLKAWLTTEDYAKLEGMMWILRKKHECLSEADKTSLKFLYKHSPLLKKAHSYAIRLTHIFNAHTSRKSALAKIKRWIHSVEQGDFRAFDKFIITLNKYKSYIVNYFKTRKSSGFVEGLNNKIKVLNRRCYGILKAETMFQRLFLDLQGFSFYG